MSKFSAGGRDSPHPPRRENPVCMEFHKYCYDYGLKICLRSKVIATPCF